MNENLYQTFEYIPANDSEIDSNQFLVVENNGEYYTLNRQEQVVVQVQGVDDVLDTANPCNVYDVPAQQFYVDNTSELITSTEQYIPPEVSSSLLTQGYLQQVPGVQENQIEQDAVLFINDTEIQHPIDDGGVCDEDTTEITLTDEQYKILEVKGWLLLESNDKTFVLDNQGLHDITHNDKMIQELKSELQQLILERQNELYEKAKPATFTTNNETRLELVVDATQTPHELSLVNRELTSDIKDIQPRISVLSEKKSKEKLIENKKNIEKKVKFKPKNFHVKTNLIFKDIPENICLGNTPSGNKLIAKVLNFKKPAITQSTGVEKNKEISKGQTPNIIRKKTADNLGASSGLPENELESLVQDAIRSKISHNYEERAALIEPVILQLLRVDAFKPAILDRNLVVTKKTRIESRSDVIISETKAILVAGRITVAGDGRQLFIPLPYMLQNLQKPPRSSSSKLGEYITKEVIFTHIHILETKREGGGVIRNSITINKNMKAIDPDSPPIVKYVCPICASVFSSNKELNDHSKYKCSEPEGDLTIDTSNNDEAAHILKSVKKQRTYICSLCKSEFLSISNCRRHLKIHNDSNKLETQETKEQSSVYRCHLCPSVYIHSATLSKHILKEHIAHLDKE